MVRERVKFYAELAGVGQFTVWGVRRRDVHASLAGERAHVEGIAAWGPVMGWSYGEAVVRQALHER